jgi:hypothetical protein
MELAQPQTASHPSPPASAPCVTIDKGIPMPPVDHSRNGRKKPLWLPFRQMEVGDSFVYPGATADRAGAAVSEASRRMAATFAVRTITEDGKRVVRVWRVA